MADWIDETLIDPETHLVFDGIKAGSLVRAQYTYCQGAVLGLETELAARTEDDGTRSGCTASSPRSAKEMAPDGVHQGCRRWRRRTVRRRSLRATWRWSAPRCRSNTPQDAAARATAANDRAQVRAVGVGLPSDRRRPAAVRAVLGPHRRHARRRGGQAGRNSSRAPSTRSAIPERDLSVQLSRLDADGGRARPSADPDRRLTDAIDPTSAVGRG